MGSSRKIAVSSLTGLLGCLVSALFQLLLTLAPVDALSPDASLESYAAASEAVPASTGGFLLSGSDPVQDSFDLTPEPGEVFAVARAPEPSIAADRIPTPENASVSTGVLAHFYSTRAPPLFSLI